jgi:hypothetical protein
MNSTYTPVDSTPTAPITYTPPPIEYTPTSFAQNAPTSFAQNAPTSFAQNAPTSFAQNAPTSFAQNAPTSFAPNVSNMPMDPPQVYQENTDDINNLYINIQDYLDMLNLLYDKTKDTFISVNTVLENIKPFIYKKVNKNI